MGAFQLDDLCCLEIGQISDFQLFCWFIAIAQSLQIQLRTGLETLQLSTPQFEMVGLVVEQLRYSWDIVETSTVRSVAKFWFRQQALTIVLVTDFLPSSVPVGNCNCNWTELALFSVFRLVVSSQTGIVSKQLLMKYIVF